MATQRRLGGFPLAVYVFALLVIPLTAVGVFSVREVKRNNVEQRVAASVVEAAGIDIRVAAVIVPLEIDRIATVGLARIAELEVEPELVLDATGIDLPGLQTENIDRLDRALADLAEVMDTEADRIRHERLVTQVTRARVAANQGVADVDEVSTVYADMFAHIHGMLSSADRVTSDLASVSARGAAALSDLQLVIDVVVTGRDETQAFSSVVLSSVASDAIEMLGRSFRHADALTAAGREFPREVGVLQRVHSQVPAVPTEAFTQEVVEGDTFSLADVLTVTQGLLAHVEYLELIGDFASIQTEVIRWDIEANAVAASQRNQITLVALGAVGVFTLLFGVVVTQSFARPLRRLRDQADRISGGDLHAEPLDVIGPTDIRKVTGAINEMAGTLSLVEDHMVALATTGDADRDDGSPLRELPGHVGASMRTSMDRVRALTTRLRLSESELAMQARHDNLTDLPNRFAVLEYLDRLLGDDEFMNGDNLGSTGVMFLDVDGFKSVNDTHGHAVGDAVLKEIAGRLRDSIRDIDFVARLGGDEFIVIVTGVPTTDRMVQFGQRLISEVEQPYSIGDQLFAVSASVGLTVIERSDDAMSAIERADAAVYQAKRRGRRRVEIFDQELQRSIEQLAELELALRQAIQHDELRVYLQPLMDLQTGMPSGAEALVRWERPGVGLVPPGQFIPIAERSGLIFELERWVLAMACHRLVEWKQMGRADGMRLAVNISGRHLIEGNLIEDLDDVIASTGADPNLLEIELTESHLLDDVDRASELLSAIRSRGIKVAIDDFGTGYSSMTYLQKLPVDVVKIDRSFIVRATTNEFDSTIVDTIVTIGKALELDIVAEGIETVEQLKYVRDAGVTQGQGFLFARPMPVDEAEKMLFNGAMFDVKELDGQLTGSQVSEI